jgi:hypothetical protein
MSMSPEPARKGRRILPGWSPLDAPLASEHPNQILSFHEWCRLNRISVRTGRRILASDKGPVLTQLGNWRVGITIGNNAKWQASRARASNDTRPRRKKARD